MHHKECFLLRNQILATSSIQTVWRPLRRIGTCTCMCAVLLEAVEDFISVASGPFHKKPTIINLHWAYRKWLIKCHLLNRPMKGATLSQEWHLLNCPIKGVTLILRVALIWVVWVAVLNWSFTASRKDRTAQE